MSVTPTASVGSLPSQIYAGPNGELMVARGALLLGAVGRQYFEGPQRYAVAFDDFTGGSQAFSTTIIDGWRSRKGSDGATVDWTVTPAINGTVVGTIGSTTASMAVSGVQLDRGLSWRASQGDLVMEAKLKLSAITNIALFVGFTDQTAALEMPINSAASADTITTNATDAVGFMFDTSMATDTFWLVGVANDVDATLQNSGIAPVAATDILLRVELTAAGVATFYIDGVAAGTAMTGAVTAATLLTPVIAGFNRTTSGTPTITADYVYTSGGRL